MLLFTFPLLLVVELLRFTEPELRFVDVLLFTLPLLLFVDVFRFTDPLLLVVELLRFTVPRFVLPLVFRLRTVEPLVDLVLFTVLLRFTCSDLAEERTSLLVRVAELTLASVRVVLFTVLVPRVERPVERGPYVRTARVDLDPVRYAYPKYGRV